jgi:hypothetical protein
MSNDKMMSLEKRKGEDSMGRRGRSVFSSPSKNVIRVLPASVSLLFSSLAITLVSVWFYLIVRFISDYIP